jgi:hypothetical protein
MNDRVVASMHSSGAKLELTALAWRRASLCGLANVMLPTKFFDQRGPSHSISSSLAFAGTVVACVVRKPRGQRFSKRPLRNWIAAKSHVR